MAKKKAAQLFSSLRDRFASPRALFARHPAELSRPQWQRALVETKNALKNKKLGIFAAGIAYYATLAFFPLVAASVAIAGFVMNRSQLEAAIHTIKQYLPGDMASLVTSQLQSALGNHATNIAAAVIAILLALFSVSGATQNMINALNTSYDVEETRNVIKLRLTSFVLTIGLLLFGFLMVGVLVTNQTVLHGVHVPELLIIPILYVRWLLLIVLVVIGLAILYHFGPNRERPAWQWVSAGAIIATVVWLLGTILFFVYVQHFGKFSNTYSLFAGIIVLMTWLNVSSLIILLGAEINHRLETKTTRRTSTR